MVSLYRAWAAWRGMGGAPGAPDALVQAGGVRFAAHARLLATHSGYFKSVLLQARPWSLADDRPFEDKNEVDSYNEADLLERERRDYEARFQDGARPELEFGIRPSEDHVVYVPNISAQQFWPLLAYMYTGYLELTPENIYQVLLATHLLHMPRALELCRSFLAQGAAAPPPALPTTTTLVKPIPSRKLPPFLPAASFHPLYPEPPTIPFLRAQHETPFRPVDPTASRHLASVGDNLRMEDHATVKEILEIPTYRINRQSSPTSKDVAQVPALGVEESAGRNEETFVKAGRSRDVLNLVKSRKSKAAVKLTVAKKAELVNPIADDNAVVIKAKPDVKLSSSQGDDNKIVIDVACCDGPVRFHRVLNTAYKSSGNDARRADSESSDTDDSYIEIEEDSRSQSETPYDNCNAFSKSLQKQMSENIRTMGTAHNENQPNCTAEEPTKLDGQDPDASNSDVSSKQDTIYTCVYCNHTFKSQYCYQKHARRHINPVSIDAVNQGTLDMVADPCCKVRKLSGTKASAVPRREVRLLDMNVQYYPCKTCGSKFPSYYFVHKHRKMCHAEELENGQETGGKHVPGDRKRKSLPNPAISYSASAAGGSREEVPMEVNEVASDKTDARDAAE